MSWLGDLLVRLKVDSADFTAGMDKASREGSKAMDQIKRAAAAMGVTLSAGAFGAMVKSAIDSADRLHDLSKATQVAAMQIGGIGFAAEQSGGSLEGAAKSFTKLNQAIAAAQSGNLEMTAMFRNVGISVEELKRSSPEQVLIRLADVFAKAEEDANKAAYAAKFFGKSFYAILPTLDEGGEKLRKNIEYFRQYSGMNDEFIRRADEFNDQMTKMKLLSAAFGNVIADDLLDPLKKLVDEMVRMKESSESAHTAAKVILAVFQSLAVAGLHVHFTFDTIGKDIARMVENLKLIASGDWEGSKRLGKLFAEDAAKARQELDRRTAAILGMGTASQERSAAAAGRSGGFDEGGAPWMLKGKRKLKDLPKGEQHALQVQKQQAAAIQEMENKRKQLFNTTEEMLMTERLYGITLDIGDGKLRKFKGTYEEFEPVVKRWLLTQAREIDERKRMLELAEATRTHLQNEQQALDARNQAIASQTFAYAQTNEEMKFQISLLGQTARAAEIMNAQRQIELDLRRDLAALPKLEEGLPPEMYEADRKARRQLTDRAAEQKKIVTDSVNARIDAERSFSVGFATAMNNYVDQATNTAAQVQQVFETTFRGMEDALVKFVQTGKLDFKSLANSIIADIIRIQVRKNIVAPLAKASEGFFKSIFGFSLGTDYVPRDMLAMVHQGEAIVPANENRNGRSGGVSIVQNIRVDSRSDRASILEAMRASKESAVAEINEQFRRGDRP